MNLKNIGLYGVVKDIILCLDYMELGMVLRIVKHLIILGNKNDWNEFVGLKGRI